MKSVFAFTTTNTFQLIVAAATICRLFEDNNQDYSFAASDIEFDLTDAQDVYDLVCDDVEVFVVVQDGDTAKFFGTFQQEGADYDPETEIYTITALHISKKIFAGLQVPYPYGEYPASMDIALNQLRAMTGCDIVADAGFFSPLTSDLLPPPKPSTQYLVSDFLVDLAKYHKAIVHVADELSSAGKYQIVFESKVLTELVVSHGYDPLIASYKEDNRNPQFDNIVFPCYVKIATLDLNAVPYPAYAFYSRDGVKLLLSGPSEIAPYVIDGVTMQFIKPGDNVALPDNAIDLRVPSGVYGSTMISALPFSSVPTFVLAGIPSVWVGENPQYYCDRNYYRLIHSFTEITVQYSDTIPVNPAETIVVRGMNLPIAEVDDDLVDVSTTIVGRLYQ